MVTPRKGRSFRPEILVGRIDVRRGMDDSRGAGDREADVGRLPGRSIIEAIAKAGHDSRTKWAGAVSCGPSARPYL